MLTGSQCKCLYLLTAAVDWLTSRSESCLPHDKSLCIRKRKEAITMTMVKVISHDCTRQRSEDDFRTPSLVRTAKTITTIAADFHYGRQSRFDSILLPFSKSTSVNLFEPLQTSLIAWSRHGVLQVLPVQSNMVKARRRWLHQVSNAMRSSQLESNTR